ncbi:MAG: glutathione S-transferase family protein [Burkholderiales bacterium]
MQLYFHPGNASLAPHMVLAQLGIPFELVWVDRENGAHRTEAYRRLNPNGQIPVLVDGGTVVYESAAICLCLADLHPAAGLVPPPQTRERAQCYQWLMWCTNTLQPALMQYFYPERYVEGDDAATAGLLKARAEARAGAMLDLLDDHLAAHGAQWFLGPSFTVVDPYVLMLGRWSRGFRRPARDRSHLGPYLRRVLARPAIAGVFATEKIAPPLV